MEIIFTSILFIIYLIQLKVLLKKYTFSIYSPLYIYTTFISVVILIAPIYYIFPDDYKINLFGIDEGFNIGVFIYILTMYLISINSFLIVFNFRKKLSFRKYAESKKSHYNLLLLVSIAFTILAILFIFIVYGFDGFFERKVYIPEYNKIMEIVRVLFMLVTVILVALIYPRYKKISILLMITLLLISFATGSRKIIIYLILYAVITIPHWRSQLKTLKIFIYLISTTLFVAIVLTFRYGEGHGFIPYFIKLIQFDFRLLLDKIYFLFYYIFIFGFNITIHTVSLDLANVNTFLISINPLPGKYIGWYEISEQLKVNRFAPTNLYGELYSFGYIFNVIFFIFLGNIFYFIEQYQRKILYKAPLLSNIIIFMIIFFAILSYEYQLRSATRFLYYLIFILLIHAGFKAFGHIKSNSR